MRKGIGEAVGESNEPSVYFPKDLSFIGYMREVFLRIPRIYLPLILFFGGLLLILQLMNGFDLLIWVGLLAILLMPLIAIPILTPLVYLHFRYQRVFRQFNRTYFEGSSMVIDHTEWPFSPWIRNIVPIASISLVTPAGQDYWETRKHVGTFSEKFFYGGHLPPEGGLYHSYSDQDDLFIVYLGKPQEIETPNRRVRFFHTVYSSKVWVKEIVIAVGKEHQDDFLRALNRKGVKIKRPRAEPQPTFIEKQAMGGSVRFG